MVISIDAEKTFDKIQYHFLIRTFNGLGIDGVYLNTTKDLYGKPTASITFNCEKLKSFFPRLGTRDGCPCLPILFKTALDILARAIKQKREINSMQIRKKEV
jgi:hypothetical protein